MNFFNACVNMHLGTQRSTFAMQKTFKRYARKIHKPKRKVYEHMIRGMFQSEQIQSASLENYGGDSNQHGDCGKTLFLPKNLKELWNLQIRVKSP